MKHKIPYSVKKRVRRFLDIVGNQETVINEREISNFFKKAFAALQFNGITGDYLEFGTGEGFSFSCANTANLRSSKPRRKLWGFDSFEGLPEEVSERDQHRAWVKGEMAIGMRDFERRCKKVGIKNYELVPGFYSDSLRDKDLDYFPPGSIAMAYVDCDLYSSTLDVLRFIEPRMKGGMILAFDDYFNFNETGVSGEKRAFYEVLNHHNGRFNYEPYIQFAYAGMSFVVEEKSEI